MQRDLALLLKSMRRAAIAGADAARAAGDRMLIPRRQKSEGHWDIVTEADRRSQEIIVEKLRQECPGIAVIAEEFPSCHVPAAEFFTVDPIDGTWEYANGRNRWGVLLGYVEEGIPSAGILLQPDLGVEAAAARDCGCRLNGQLFRFAPGSSRTAVISSGPWLRHQPRLVSGIIPALLTAGFRVLGAPCATACALALLTGDADVYIGFEEKIWDVAPAAAAVTEASGAFASLDGASAFFASVDRPLVLGSSPEIVKSAAALITGSTA